MTAAGHPLPQPAPASWSLHMAPSPQHRDTWRLDPNTRVEPGHMSRSLRACSTSCVHPPVNTGSANPLDTHTFRTMPICTQTDAFAKVHSHVSREAHMRTRNHVVLNSPPPWTPSLGLKVHVLPPVLIPAHPLIFSNATSVSVTVPRPLWSWSPTTSYCQVPWSFASPPADSPCWVHSPWVALLSWVSSSLTG